MQTSLQDSIPTIETSPTNCPMPRRVSFKMDDETETDTSNKATVRFALSEEHTAKEHTTHTTTAHTATTDTYASTNAPIRWLTDEDCRQRWYQRDELTAMKQAVRMAILYGISDDTTDDTSTNDTNTQDGTYSSAIGIGLGRFSLERSQHKKSAIYHVQMAAHHVRQKLYHHPEYTEIAAIWLRNISRRCTAWARHVATEEGFATFCEVYGDPIHNNNNNNSNNTGTNDNETWTLFQDYSSDLLAMANDDDNDENDNLSSPIVVIEERTCAAAPVIPIESSSAPGNNNNNNKKRKDVEPINLGLCNRNVRPRLDSISTPSTPVLSA